MQPNSAPTAHFYYQHGYVPAPRPMPAGPPRTEPLATGALVCSLLGLFLMGFPSIAGLALGYMARNRIRLNPALTGDGVALAGIIISYVGVGGLAIALIAPLLAAVLVA